MTRVMQRDVRLDSFRGLALVVMTIDHFRGSIQGFTYQAVGFVTAAELFVFLSGLVAGIVFTKRMRTHTFTQVRRQCWKRAGVLYVYHLLTFAVVVAAASAFDPLEDAWRAWIPKLSDALLFEHRGTAMGLAAVLVYQPTHLDILPMYAVFLFLLPFALKLLERYGPMPLLALAFAGWMLARFGRTQGWATALLGPLGVRPPYFDMLAWQGLFWMGLVCGRGRALARPWLPALVKWGWLPALAVSVALLAVRYDLISNRWVLTLFDLRGATVIPWLGWLRLLNFLCLALAVAGLASRWPRAFNWPWFALLGRHSLQVYTAHIAAVFFLAPVWMTLRRKGWLNEVLWTAAVLGGLTLTAWLHERWLRHRRDLRERSEEAVPEGREAGESDVS